MIHDTYKRISIYSKRDYLLPRETSPPFVLVPHSQPLERLLLREGPNKAQFIAFDRISLFTMSVTIHQLRGVEERSAASRERERSKSVRGPRVFFVPFRASVRSTAAHCIGAVGRTFMIVSSV